MSHVIPEKFAAISDLIAKIAPEKHAAVMTILLSPPPPKTHQKPCQACSVPFWTARLDQRFCRRRPCQLARSKARQARSRSRKKASEKT